jgi:hypothetical protein
VYDARELQRLLGGDSGQVGVVGLGRPSATRAGRMPAMSFATPPVPTLASTSARRPWSGRIRSIASCPPL